MNSKPDKSKTYVRRGRSARPWREKWILRLYVAGQTPETRTAIKNINVVCNEQLSGNYHLKVIDLTEHPQFARVEQIVAIPTLVRKSPLPAKTIIGDLSDMTSVLAGLSLADQGATTRS